MTVHAIAHKQAGYVVSGLEQLTKKDAHWIKREALSRVVYLVGCESLALLAIAYHSCMLSLKSVAATALALASLIPISLLRNKLKDVPKWLQWSYLGEYSLTPLLAAVGVAVMAPGLTLFAQHAESMRRVIKLTMPLPNPKWYEKLGWSEEQIAKIVFFATLLVVEVVCVTSLLYAEKKFASGQWVMPHAYLWKKIDSGDWPGRDQMRRLQAASEQWTSFAWHSISTPVKTAGKLYVDTVIDVYLKIGSAIKYPFSLLINELCKNKWDHQPVINIELPKVSRYTAQLRRTTENQSG